MARDDKEFKDVYVVYLKEYTKQGYRIPIETYRHESVSGAIKKYEDLILENEGHCDKRLLVELQFISQNRYMTLKEKHLWKEVGVYQKE